MPLYRGTPNLPQPLAASLLSAAALSTAGLPHEQTAQLAAQTNAAIARQTLPGAAAPQAEPASNAPPAGVTRSGGADAALSRRAEHAATALAPSLSAAAPPREQAAQLLGQTDAAIARQTLLRIGSLPGDETSGPTNGNDNAPRLMFEIPVLTPQGTAVAPMTIERDGGNRGAREDRAAMARELLHRSRRIERPRACPHHAGRRTRVGDAQGRTRGGRRTMAAGLPLLDAGLRRAEVEPGELRCPLGNHAANLCRAAPQGRRHPAHSWIRRHERRQDGARGRARI